jgi:hypothetical protein
MVNTIRDRYCIGTDKLILEGVKISYFVNHTNL